MSATERAAITLEWKRFLLLAQGEARTERGKFLLGAFHEASQWAPNLAVALTLQQETQEATPLLDRDGLWGPLSDLPDPSETLERLRRGSVLELNEFVVLRQWLYAVDSWVQVPREEIRGELFRKALAQLPDPFGPLHPLEKILTPEGELSERASPRCRRR